HLLAGLLPAGIEEILIDDGRDQRGWLDGNLLVRPPALAAAITPPGLGVAALPVLRPVALRRRIGPARPGLDRRQRAAPRARDLERQEEGDDDQEPVQDGPAPHQRLPGGRRLFVGGATGGETVVVGCEAPGVVVVAAARVVVTVPATVVLVVAAPGAAAVVVVAPGAAAMVVLVAPGFVAAPSSPLASAAASVSAGAPSSALACSPSTKPVTSSVADSVRGPLAPGTAPRRFTSTNGMASWCPYSRPETSSANGLSSPDRVRRTATLR